MNSIKKYASQKKDVALTSQDLIGTWKLQHFFIEKENKDLVPWGENPTGLLIYSADGYMSVSFNKDLVSSDCFEKDVFKSVLSYSGEYQLQKPTGEELTELLNNPFTNAVYVLKHHILQASDPRKIGQIQTRFIAYETAADKSVWMTLSSSMESFGRGLVKWKKEKTNI